MVFLENKLKELKFKFIAAKLKHTNPHDILSQSHQKALAVFNNALKKNAYQQILRKKNASVTPLSSINEFRQHVPVIEKKDIFDSSSAIMADILAGLKPQDKQSMLLSSGTSGAFAFGHMPYSAQETHGLMLEVLFQEYFQILKRKTLVVNAFAQVKLPALTAVGVDIGPKADSLHYLLKSVSPHFEQTIVIGDNLFIKNALEDGINAGIDYATLNVSLVLGGVYLPESLRRHLQHILANTNARIYSSMGISEFGLNLFFESPETVELRKQITKNVDLQNRICPPNFPNYLPVLFNYLPQNYFLEELNGELVVTALTDSSQMPLIRYNTHDVGHIIYFDELEGILKEFGLTKILPPFKSPLVLMYGRSQKNNSLCIEALQECLWQDPDLGSKTTGFFKAIPEAGHTKISLQLKKGVIPSPALMQKYHDLLSPALSSLTVELFPYQDFPYGMDIDFQKKFQYI